MNEHEGFEPRRPAGLRWSVGLWTWMAALFLLIGFASRTTSLPASLGLALWIGLGAVFLRSGRRGARYVLTATAVLLLVPAFSGVVALGEDAGAGPVLLGLLLVVVPLVAAAVLMWLPSTGQYFRQLREARPSRG
ncbi:hypothetical protein [Kutzneria sp. NPDC052558]|uniref:hypothetical protein n=1 Tax=Kutzneria sp. NPDC052558 TaxID=3364121 RepID=UPI0037C64759